MVKNYTSKQLLERVKQISGFNGIPSDYWLLFVRSNEDLNDTFDDKLYIFKGSEFHSVLACTTNKGNKGTGVVESDRWNYGMWKIGMHRGRMIAGVQRIGVPYRRDFTNDKKTNPTTEIKTDIRGFNLHTVSYDLSRNLVATKIGGWSEGCFVVPDVQKYVKLIELLKSNTNQIIDMVIITEF